MPTSVFDNDPRYGFSDAPQFANARRVAQTLYGVQQDELTALDKASKKSARLERDLARSERKYSDLMNAVSNATSGEYAHLVSAVANLDPVAFAKQGALMRQAIASAEPDALQDAAQTLRVSACEDAQARLGRVAGRAKGRCRPDHRGGQSSPE